MKSFFFLIACFLIFSLQASGQVIFGKVFDTTKEHPLPGADIYLDGTTIGTISGLDGTFKISTDTKVNAPLIVNFLGYKKIQLEDPYREEGLEVILEPQTAALGEVVIKKTRTSWSRRKMLREFKKQFLGANRAAEFCIILNEEDLDLSFDQENKKLSVRSDVPIKIRNNFLGYEIDYDLSTFNALYKSPKRNNPECYFTYYAGSSRYKDMALSGGLLSRFNERRMEEYKGSTMHFFRSILAQSLDRNGFVLYLNNGSVPPNEVMKLYTNGENYMLKFKRNFKIKYRRNNEITTISKENLALPIQVFPDGNYSPINSIRFDGAMSKERLGNTLPLDYEPQL